MVGLRTPAQQREKCSCQVQSSTLRFGPDDPANRPASLGMVMVDVNSPDHDQRRTIRSAALGWCAGHHDGGGAGGIRLPEEDPAVRHAEKPD